MMDGWEIIPLGISPGKAVTVLSGIHIIMSGKDRNTLTRVEAL